LYFKTKNELGQTNKKFEEAEQIIFNYLKKHPQDTEAWLLLIMIETNPPLENPFEIIKYANHILSYDSTNVYALLFLSFAQDVFLGGIQEETYHHLCLAQSSELEVISMIELVKANYFAQKNDVLNYEKALKKSIVYCSSHVKNLSDLGIFYLNQGKAREGKELIRKALDNVKSINHFSDPYKPNEHDATGMNEFFDYYYKGTTLRDAKYDYLKSLIEA
jgi:tetratricopeptide (TPR) repeat protein